MVCESVRNARVETGLRGLMVLAVVDEQAQRAGRQWHCVLLLLQWLQDAPAYRDQKGGELAYLPRLPSPASPADDSPRRGPLQPGGSSPRSGRLGWLICLTVLTFWRKYPYPLIRLSQAWSPETRRLSARLMFDQPTGPHVVLLSPSARLPMVRTFEHHAVRIVKKGRHGKQRCSVDPPPPCPRPCPLAPPPAVPSRESHLRR